MTRLVNALNAQGIETLGCCCGHGRYCPTVIIRDTDGEVAEFFTGIKIPRTRRFYKTDDGGYYYVPEINKPKEG